MNDIDKAIQDVARNFEGQARGLAKSMGLKSPGAFSNKVNPFHESCINIRDLIRMTEVTQDLRIIKALAEHFDLVTLPVPQVEDSVSDMELLQAWAEWEVQRGEIVDLIKKALEDGKVVHNELRQIEKEIVEDFEKAMQLLSRLEQLDRS